MLKYDTDKAVQNIRAKTIDSPKNDGQWEVVCEVVGCKSKTTSSKLHGWKTDKWITCPIHEA